RIELAANALENAYNAYADAVALEPGNLEALGAVSQLGLRTGHLKESREATQAILLFSPAQPDALVMMGVHSMIQRRLDEAEEYADRVLAIDAGNESAVILKARI